jgi:hypothetical protein
MTRKNIEKERWKMSKQKYTSIPQAHVDNLYKKIAELEKERDDFEVLNSELYGIIFTHLGWWDLKGINEIDHDDIIKALKEQGK